MSATPMLSMAVWIVYDVNSDGTIANGKILFNATKWTKNKPGLADGIKIDRDGNLFAAGPGGIHVIAPDGTHLGSIETDAPTGNLRGARTDRLFSSPRAEPSIA